MKAFLINLSSLYRNNTHHTTFFVPGPFSAGWWMQVSPRAALARILIWLVDDKQTKDELKAAAEKDPRLKQQIYNELIMYTGDDYDIILRVFSPFREEVPLEELAQLGPREILDLTKDFWEDAADEYLWGTFTDEPQVAVRSR